MATSSRLNLTRDQLASFLQDHEQIKQFERLFADVSQLEPTTLADLALNAGNANQKAVEALDAVAQLAQDTALQADNKAQQALDAISQLSSLVELLATAPPEREFKRSRYGSFYDTTTQTASVINTATEITFNTTDLSSGVYLGGSPQSRVYVDTDGIYNFQTSIQLDSTVATAQEFYLWFALNGVDVTNSASQLRIQGNNAEVFVALNYFFTLKAGDYVELIYSVSNLGVQLLAAPAAAPHPGIPSVILTVSNNIQGFQ
jgi:hypothetical protein